MDFLVVNHAHTIPKLVLGMTTITQCKIYDIGLIDESLGIWWASKSRIIANSDLRDASILNIFKATEGSHRFQEVL